MKVSTHSKHSAKRGPGRPPDLDAPKKSVVAVRMMPADLTQFIKLAEAVGIPHSTLANVVLKQYIDNPRSLFGSKAPEQPPPAAPKKRTKP